MFDKTGVLFWPVGTGDSTTFVVRENDVIFQVDLRHIAKSEDEATDCSPVVDHLEELLPKVDGKPCLSSFALTHPDQDHIQGFSELLDRVTIGELWFSPRIFREQTGDLCDDAKAFREEAHRRVTATIEAGGDPGAGNRVRLVGYDPLLEEEHYRGFPKQFFSIPGSAVTMLDGEDLTGSFRAFIHAPFKQDDLVGDRNNTSLVMQVILGDDPALGGVLLFGDHQYQTIRKIFDVSKANDNEDNLRWQVILSSHHCSKSVMYQEEDGKTVLKQDILDDFERLQVGDGYVVSSSNCIPSSNASGDNPPHAVAKARYQEIAKGGFLCTHDDGGHAEPLRFDMIDGDINYTGETSADDGALGAAVSEARGSDETPSTKVGFGEWR
ncbi:MAG: hypothetical protein M3Q19_00780 [Pseudomonadota bacterium]|nr:hypothetical protein [Pseudomonadota bacterium]